MIDTTYSCDTIALDKSMGKVYLNPIDKKSIERRDKMTKEKMKQTIDTIKHLDSMKAVKVAFDLSESNQDSINKIMQVVHGNVNNINLLAQRITDLEIMLKSYEQRKN